MRRLAGLGIGLALAVIGAPDALGATRGQPDPVRFTVAAIGDMLTQPPVIESARVESSPDEYDFMPLLAGLGPRIGRADLAICHQELTLGPGPVQFFPHYLAPPSLAQAMGAIGCDASTVASNHSLDHGSAGIATTIEALRDAGLRHTGTYRTRSASRRTLILDVKGVRLALLSYTDTTNGIFAERRFEVNYQGLARIRDDVRRAVRRGAEAVIVNLHTTGDFDPITPDQRKLVRRLTEIPAVTAVISQGAHSVRSIRYLNSKPVVYDEGDALDAFAAPATERASGIIAELRFVARAGKVAVPRVRYLPLYSRPEDRAALTIAQALGSGQAEDSALRAKYRRIVGVVGRSEAVQPVPRRLP